MTASAKKIGASILLVLGSVCSIGAFFVLLFEATYVQINILLLIVCLFLVALLTILYRLVNRESSNRYPSGRRILASFAYYSTKDGNNVSYNIHRVIQIKELISTHYVHDFYWTGTEEPDIRSELQDIEDLVRTQDGVYDKIVLKLDSAKIYNESTVVHVGYEIDDSDHASETYVSFKVPEPMDIITWNIELKHKDKIENARLEKAPINSEHGMGFAFVKSVPFDMETRSFRFSLPRPEVGFFHRIRWTR